MYENEFQAIRKFFYLAMNFNNVEYHFHWGDTQTAHYVPDFIRDVRWTCGSDHMASKWMECCDRQNNPYAYMMDFFGKLDDSNRKLLVEWIMKNYKG